MLRVKTFQLILNPIRDWNKILLETNSKASSFQLILNPIRDWNLMIDAKFKIKFSSN